MPSRGTFAAMLAPFLALAPAAAAAQSFVHFESGHVRPIAAAPDGNRVFAVNTPDNRLAILDVTANGLRLAAEVPVGLEPVAVATRINGLGRVEAWVVNHLSDSVSIVEVDPADVALSRVVRTLHVGDEPRDIVFAGSAGNRAFITAAHRGQNRPGDPQLTTPGVGRADVWVFDADSLGAALGGTPLTILALFGDTPRALAASPDGALVYAAVFHSGNQTTAILEPVASLPTTPTKPPNPPFAPPGAPSTGLIVKFDNASGRWRDELGVNDWSPLINFHLPDFDVFRINANGNPPALVTAIPRVGTVLFNMAVHPVSGKVFVTNLESRNHVRFEGIAPVTSPVEWGVKGHIAESRISVVDGSSVLPVHLNPHIDYSTVPGPLSEVELSLAFPLDLTFSADGSRLFVTGFGSEKVGVFDTAALESGTAVRDLIEVGGGPSGVVLDEARQRLYVMNRFTHRVAVVEDVFDAGKRAVRSSVALRHDPSPVSIKRGRRFLYDARRTSAHGDSACASCHIFGDLDSLAWDLGDPTGVVEANFNPFVGGPTGFTFHPLKGPMTTQSLRGMAEVGPMHWRGDRSGAEFNGDPRAFDTDAAFKAFNPAFVGLLGRAGELDASEMQAFTDFILELRYPPNPIRALDDAPTAAQAAGENFFNNTITDGGRTCEGCHANPLGGNGQSSLEGETQEFKVPHLRNMYQKIGMFGMPPFIPNMIHTTFQGNQIRGFAFLHDGAVDSLFNFVNPTLFQNLNTTRRRELEAFMLAFDTGLRPAVGQQVSLTPATASAPPVLARLDLLVQRADAGDCDLVVKGVVDGEARGAVYAGGDLFRSDRAADPLAPRSYLIGLSTGPQAVAQVFTCVPPGSGTRIGIDRDEDGFLDRDELDAGTNPADRLSFPGGPATVTVRTGALLMQEKGGDAARRKWIARSKTSKDPSNHRITPPPFGSAGDPTLHGAVLRVYNANGGAESIEVALPAAGWKRAGAEGYRYKSATTAGGVKVAVIGPNRLLLRGGGAAWSFTLDEPAQGYVAVRLTLGSSVEWCAEGAAHRSGKPATSARHDRPGYFRSSANLPPPAECPAPPA